MKNDPLNEFIILTSKNNKTVFASDNFSKIYDFVRNNPDAKFRTINYEAKPSVISKETFLERYFKETQDQARLFELVDILLPRYSNASYFVANLNLLDQYKKYKEVTDKHL